MEAQPNSKSMTKEEFEGCKLTFANEALLKAIGFSSDNADHVVVRGTVLKLINTVEHGFKEGEVIE